MARKPTTAVFYRKTALPTFTLAGVLAGTASCGLAVVVLLAHAASLRAEDELQQRRDRLQAMSAAEKEDLRRKERRFYELPTEEQTQLRELHAEITTATDSDKLQAVMTRYYEWLKTLRPGERAEVLSLSPDKRIDKIRCMLEEQSIQRFQRMAASQLEPSDVTLIFRWINDYVTNHEAELMASLPEDKRKFAENNSRARRFMLTGALLQQQADRLIITDEEVHDLQSGLSRQAQEILQKEQDRKQKIRIIRGWMEAAASSMFRNSGPPTAPVSNEELTRFLDQEVSERDRAYLDGLPAERFRREAERFYHFYKYRRERDRSGGHSGPPDDPNRSRGFRPGSEKPGERTPPCPDGRSGTGSGGGKSRSSE